MVTNAELREKVAQLESLVGMTDEDDNDLSLVDFKTQLHGLNTELALFRETLRQGRLECWQGGLDQQGVTDRCMAPIGRACKRWDDSARRWHGQELDGCKASLLALSWRGQGKQG
ncbi:hypothetical protein HAX54_034174 [Datura stramonium]|uniref:Uncharacterized protein n=1 Tax=Datura stramonium TaxID=4076 RepID=A0ABS8SE07_DATST|nr:hypothetical protein [Datura stramonium]